MLFVHAINATNFVVENCFSVSLAAWCALFFAFATLATSPLLGNLVPQAPSPHTMLGRLQRDAGEVVPERVLAYKAALRCCQLVYAVALLAFAAQALLAQFSSTRVSSMLASIGGGGGGGNDADNGGVSVASATAFAAALFSSSSSSSSTTAAAASGGTAAASAAAASAAALVQSSAQSVVFYFAPNTIAQRALLDFSAAFFAFGGSPRTNAFYV
jgi:hypothetical protein